MAQKKDKMMEAYIAKEWKVGDVMTTKEKYVYKTYETRDGQPPTT